MTCVWLDAHAREAIATEAASRRLRETGGPLFGYESGEDVVILRALPPGPRTRHRRTRLIPDPRDVKAQIDTVFEETAGAFYYLGDWHSHPRGSALASDVDVRTAAKIAADQAVELPCPLVLIQPTRPFRIHVGISALGAYRWCPQQRRLEDCELILCSVRSEAED